MPHPDCRLLTPPSSPGERVVIPSFSSRSRRLRTDIHTKNLTTRANNCSNNINNDGSSNCSNSNSNRKSDDSDDGADYDDDDDEEEEEEDSRKKDADADTNGNSKLNFCTLNDNNKMQRRPKSHDKLSILCPPVWIIDAPARRAPLYLVA